MHLNLLKCTNTYFTDFYKLQNPFKFHIPSIFQNNDPAMWVRAGAWVTGECLGKLHRQVHSKKYHLLKDIHLSPQPHSCPLPRIRTTKSSHTLVKTFLLNVKYHHSYILIFKSTLYRCLEKFTVHSLSPFSFMNVTLLFLGKPQISSQNRWFWKSNYQKLQFQYFSSWYIFRP